MDIAVSFIFRQNYGIYLFLTKIKKNILMDMKCASVGTKNKIYQIYIYITLKAENKSHPYLHHKSHFLFIYLSLNSSFSSSQKKKKKRRKPIIFPPNKLLMFLLLMTSPLNFNCFKFNNQSFLFFSLFLTYHLLISTIKPTSYLYLTLNSLSFSSPKKKKKKNHLPTKQIANISPINDFNIKSQLP